MGLLVANCVCVGSQEIWSIPSWKSCAPSFFVPCFSSLVWVRHIFRLHYYVSSISGLFEPPRYVQKYAREHKSNNLKWTERTICICIWEKEALLKKERAIEWKEYHHGIKLKKKKQWILKGLCSCGNISRWREMYSKSIGQTQVQTGPGRKK